MLTIARLFGKSPFAPLQTHMDKVASCVGALPALFEALTKQDMETIQKIGAEIARLEHEADLTKADIRNHLPKSLFLPVDRGAILDILSLQDALADQAETIAQQATLHELVLLPGMKEEFLAFCGKNIEAFWLARQVMQELEELLECSFGGIEAQKVKRMIEQIAFCKYEKTQKKMFLMRHLYQGGTAMSFPTFHLCHILVEEIGCLARFSEKLGDRVRMLLDLK